jgi:ribosome-associated protein
MDDLPVGNNVTIPASELRISFARSGGPGGQNVNKVETKVELRWSPLSTSALGEADRQRLLQRLRTKLTAGGDIVVTSNRTRDQIRNRFDALEKLAKLVRSALERPKFRRETRPTQAAVESRLQEKKEHGIRKKQRVIYLGED